MIDKAEATDYLQKGCYNLYNQVLHRKLWSGWQCMINFGKLEQSDHHFADNVSNVFFQKENFYILI